MPTKIARLTVEQMQALRAYREEWFRILTNTAPANKPLVEKIIGSLYEAIGKSAPRFVWPASPEVCRDFIDKLGQDGGADPLSEQLSEQLKPSYEWRDHIDREVRKRLDECLYDPLRAAVEPIADAILLEELPGLYDNFCYGSFRAHEIALDAFPALHLGLKYDAESQERLRRALDIAESCSVFWPYDKVCVICDRPTEFHLQHGKLHNSSGMALRFSDGWGIYRLNGVTVPDGLATTPSHKLDPSLVEEVTDVELRLEIVRKIGMDRLVNAFSGEILDKVGNFELYRLKLSDGRFLFFLKMFIPSTGDYHIKAVRQGCPTVADALAAGDPEDIPLELRERTLGFMDISELHNEKRRSDRMPWASRNWSLVDDFLKRLGDEISHKLSAKVRTGRDRYGSGINRIWIYREDHDFLVKKSVYGYEHQYVGLAVCLDHLTHYYAVGDLWIGWNGDNFPHFIEFEVDGVDTITRSSTQNLLDGLEPLLASHGMQRLKKGILGAHCHCNEDVTYPFFSVFF